MRKLEIKHPEYGKVGKLGQYDDRKLVQDKELPERVDFLPTSLPSVAYGQTKPDEGAKSEVTKKSLEVLDKVLIDGVPLTKLYNFKMNMGNTNPHGYGVPSYVYYLTGMKRPDVNIKEMVLESVLKIMNEKR